MTLLAELESRLSVVQAKSEVQKLIVKAQDGALEAQPGRTIMESFEGQVCLQYAVALS